MSISKTQIQSLYIDGKITIVPYDAESLHEEYYTLHIGNRISYCEEKFSRNTVMDAASLPAFITESLTKNGYILEPDRIYNIELQESVTCKTHSCILRPNGLLSKYGVNVIPTRNSYITNGKPIIVTVTVTHAIRVYPGMTLCDLYFENTDDSPGVVPIGGIIAWSGSKIPYGYCICDGSHGSPNLVNQIICGSSYNTGGHISIDTGDYGSLYLSKYNLVFIMRYK